MEQDVEGKCSADVSARWNGLLMRNATNPRGQDAIVARNSFRPALVFGTIDRSDSMHFLDGFALIWA
jgi:hypothetical protein